MRYFRNEWWTWNDNYQNYDHPPNRQSASKMGSLQTLVHHTRTYMQRYRKYQWRDEKMRHLSNPSFISDAKAILGFLAEKDEKQLGAEQETLQSYRDQFSAWKKAVDSRQDISTLITKIDDKSNDQERTNLMIQFYADVCIKMHYEKIMILIMAYRMKPNWWPRLIVLVLYFQSWKSKTPKLKLVLHTWRNNDPGYKPR